MDKNKLLNKKNDYKIVSIEGISYEEKEKLENFYRILDISDYLVKMMYEYNNKKNWYNESFGLENYCEPSFNKLFYYVNLKINIVNNLDFDIYDNKKTNLKILKNKNFKIYLGEENVFLSSILMNSDGYIKFKDFHYKIKQLSSDEKK